MELTQRRRCKTEKRNKMKKMKRVMRIVHRFERDVPEKEFASDVRVVCVSDTHNVAFDESLFPKGDILIHAGDHTVSGTKDQLERASMWLHGLAKRFTHGCVTVGGNHDMPLDKESFLSFCSGHEDAAPMGSKLGYWDKESVRGATGWFNRPPVVRLLHHELVEVAGLTIFGSPFVPLTPSRQKLQSTDPLRSLGFNRSDEELEKLYSQILPNVDILVTHTPARGILDASIQYGGKIRPEPISIGSTVLLKHLSRIKPLLHVFGHEHDSRGMLVREETTFVNGAAVEGDRGTGSVYTPKPDFCPTVIDFRSE